jgi:hypothetical protein
MLGDEAATSVPEIDEDELNREMEEAAQAESGTDADAEQSDTQAQADEGEREPLPYEELAKRYENVQKALKQERGQRRELDQWRGQMEERLSQLQSKASPAEQQADGENKPDRNKDPLAYLDWLDQKVTQYEEREREQQTRAQQEQQQRQYLQQVQEYGAQAEEAFRKEAPDYDDAATYYAKSRLEELQHVYNMTPQAAQQYFGQELQAAVVQNAQRGQNPAAAIYAAAKARGYVAKSNEAQAKLDQMKEGRKSSPTMPQGGKGKANGVSMDELLKIEDPKEFEKRWAEAERQGLFSR